jgi:hypothetical protein
LWSCIHTTCWLANWYNYFLTHFVKLYIHVTYSFWQLGVHHKEMHVFLSSTQLQLLGQNSNNQSCDTSTLHKSRSHSNVISFLFMIYSWIASNIYNCFLNSHSILFNFSFYLGGRVHEDIYMYILLVKLYKFLKHLW